MSITTQCVVLLAVIIMWNKVKCLLDHPIKRAWLILSSLYQDSHCKKQLLHVPLPLLCMWCTERSSVVLSSVNMQFGCLLSSDRSEQHSHCCIQNCLTWWNRTWCWSCTNKYVYTGDKCCGTLASFSQAFWFDDPQHYCFDSICWLSFTLFSAAAGSCSNELTVHYLLSSGLSYRLALGYSGACSSYVQSQRPKQS